MIVVLAGTSEGRLVLEELAAAGYTTLASVTTEYGAELAGGAGAQRVVVGARDAAGWRELMAQEGVKAVVDASHPFAAEATRQVRLASEAEGIPYLRCRRQPLHLPQHPLLRLVGDWPAAAREAASLGKVLFLTIGTRHLGQFLAALPDQGHRVVARVLPEPDNLALCRQLGLQPRDIVALQGPFSSTFNAALFRHFGAEVVVTKESGEAGGTSSKLAAALELGLPVVVIKRPAEEGPGGDAAWVVEQLRAILPPSGLGEA